MIGSLIVLTIAATLMAELLTGYTPRSMAYMLATELIRMIYGGKESSKFKK